MALLRINDQLAATAALKSVGRDAHVLLGTRSGSGADLDEIVLLHGLPLSLSQVLLPQPRLFLQLQPGLLLPLE